MKAQQIRDTYLSFFAERGHKIVPSASLVPSVHDPTVLLTTAGMQPFKPYFLGRETPPAPRLTDRHPASKRSRKIRPMRKSWYPRIAPIFHASPIFHANRPVCPAGSRRGVHPVSPYPAAAASPEDRGGSGLRSGSGVFHTAHAPGPRWPIEVLEPAI